MANQSILQMKQILTAKEEELMKVFWAKGEMCIRDLVNSLPEPKPSYTTVSTQVTALENKGFLNRRPIANTFLYRVAITEKEYRASTVNNIVERYYHNSFAECWLYLLIYFVHSASIIFAPLKRVLICLV